ncbi:DUF4166 domain-containing protein [Lysobacter sp. CA199]|uniref:DUF4166 domain-containing protein n=1 Tax=Lysobacter sp. CA199 TaxID=3455608 RepID=UPI003F8D2BCA
MKNVPTPAQLSAREGLYPRVLGVRFMFMPRTLRLLHGRGGRQRYHGEVEAERGEGLCSRVFARIAGLPKAYTGPIEVEIDAGVRGETWIRRFGKSTMRSRLVGGDGLVFERLGPMRFAFALELAGEVSQPAPSGMQSLHSGEAVAVSSAGAGGAVYSSSGETLHEIASDPGLTWRLVRVRALGLPLPLGWFGGVHAREFERDGRYRFDVRAALPGIGLLVHYRGWLDVEG